MKYLKLLFILVLLLPSCNNKSKIVGDYQCTTRFIKSRISVNANGTFHQELHYSGKKIELDGKWNQKNNMIEFNKLYYLVEVSKFEEGSEMREPKLYYLASFNFSNNMLYTEGRKEVYRK